MSAPVASAAPAARPAETPLARFAADFAANLRGTLVPAVFDEVRSETPRLVASLGAVVPGLRAEIEAMLVSWLGAHREREAVVSGQLGRA